MQKFSGLGVALATPFHQNNDLDFASLKKLIDYTIKGKVNYLVSLGSTGESATLNNIERQQVWEQTIEIVDGRVPVVAGIAGNSTRDTIEALKQFDLKGFDAILVLSPYYNKPSQKGIYEHYKAIAETSSLPIILYNVPGRTGSNISSETTLRLAHDFKNIIGIKEASANFDQFNEIIKDKPSEFLLISGDDPITLPLIAMGAAGVISVAGNAVPSIFSKMVNLALKENFIEAKPLHYKTIKLIQLLFQEGNPSGIKAALKHLGICSDHVRLPLTPVSKQLYTQIAETITQIDNS